jgi:hypothetical protein
MPKRDILDLISNFGGILGLFLGLGLGAGNVCKNQTK